MCISRCSITTSTCLSFPQEYYLIVLHGHLEFIFGLNSVFYGPQMGSTRQCYQYYLGRRIFNSKPNKEQQGLRAVNIYSRYRTYRTIHGYKLYYITLFKDSKSTNPIVLTLGHSAYIVAL